MKPPHQELTAHRRATYDVNAKDALYDSIQNRFFGLLRWIVTILLQSRGLAEVHRRSLHKCLHAIASSPPGGPVPDVVVKALTAGEVYELFLATALHAGEVPSSAPNSHRAHTALVEHLKQLGQAGELTARPADTVTMLSQTQPFARDEHATAMLALIHARDRGARANSALPAAVAAEVSRFAPFSAASEQPQDAEDAVSLWLAKVAGCINSVTQNEEGANHQTSTAPVPVMHDFFAACRDGRAIAALLAYYRPDLVKLEQLDFESDDAAAQAAGETIKVALHAASRASCPCPLTDDDFLRQSPLLRPVALSWLEAAFHKLSELPLSTRLAVGALPVAHKIPRPRTARPQSARTDHPRGASSRPGSAVTGAANAAARPGSRRGRGGEADPNATSPGRGAPHDLGHSAAPSHIPLAKNGFSAATYALAEAAHTRAPHGTVRAASRPASAVRPASAPRSPKDRYANGHAGATTITTTTATGPHISPRRQPYTDTEVSEHEVAAWREGEGEAEDELTVRQLSSFVTQLPVTPEPAPSTEASHPATPPQASPGPPNGASLAAGGPAAPLPKAESPAHPPVTQQTGVATTQARFEVYPAPIDEPYSKGARSPKPIQSRVPLPPDALPRFSPAGARHDGPSKIPTPTSSRSPSRAGDSRSGTPKNLPRAPAAAAVEPPQQATSLPYARPRSRRSPDRASPTRPRRRSVSPGPGTRELARKLSQTLVSQLSSLPLQGTDDDESAASPPVTLEGVPTSGGVDLRSSREAWAPNPPTDDPVLAQGVGGDGEGDSRDVSDSDSSEDAVELGEEADENYHEVFGDLREVPSQVRATLTKGERETFEELAASILAPAAASFDARASYTITKPRDQSPHALPKVDAKYSAFFVDASSQGAGATAAADVGTPRRTPDVPGPSPSRSVESRRELPLHSRDGTPVGRSAQASATGAHPQDHQDHGEGANVWTAQSHGPSAQASPAPTPQPTPTPARSRPHSRSHLRFPVSETLRVALGSSWESVAAEAHRERSAFESDRTRVFSEALKQMESAGGPISGTTHGSSAAHEKAPLRRDPTPEQRPGRNDGALSVAELEIPPAAPLHRPHLPTSPKGNATRKSPVRQLPKVPSPATFPTPAVVAASPDVAVTTVRERNSSAAFEIQLDTPDPNSLARKQALAERQRKRRELELRAKQQAKPAPALSVGAPTGGIKERRGVPVVGDGGGGDGSVEKGERKADKPGGKDGKRTNRQLVRNAITHTCLAGPVNATQVGQVTDKLDASTATHFLLLLRGPNDLQFRALYEYDFDLHEALKLVGRGPKKIAADAIVHTFRYNSGTRRFAPTRTVEVNNLVDAFCVPPSRVKKNPSVI